MNEMALFIGDFHLILLLSKFRDSSILDSDGRAMLRLEHLETGEQSCVSEIVIIIRSVVVHVFEFKSFSRHTN